MRNAFDVIKPQQITKLAGNLHSLLETRLWAKIVLGMIVGILIGVALGPAAGWITPERSTVIVDWLALPGRIFLVMLQMIVVPLVFASVIRGISASGSPEQLKSVGLRIALYFLATTTVAIVIGVGFALLVQPGTYIDGQVVASSMERSADVVPKAEAPGLSDVPSLIVSILPDNPLGSMVETEMLQVVLFGLIVGAAVVGMAADRARPLLDLMESIQEVCMTVVKWCMKLAPIAVLGLLAQITAKVGLDVLAGLTIYMATVGGGLLCLMIFYMLVVKVLAGRSPVEFLSQIRDAQLLAFSTSSSAATMPYSLEIAEKQLGVRSSISQFLVPLGATVNMDGTALYQGVATVFLAQVFGVHLGLPELVLVVVTAVAASIGAPSTPGVGIVILALVLQSVGVPEAGIALIIGVDRILDMSRTSVNVTGDLTACVVMERWIGKNTDSSVSLA